LISLARGLKSILSPGGNLILSGLTRDQVRWVSASYRNRGLIPAQTFLLGNWATLSFIVKEKRPKHFRVGRLASSAVGKGRDED
jgi:ribosomal protein L11 methylase PrmA